MTVLQRKETYSPSSLSAGPRPQPAPRGAEAAAPPRPAPPAARAALERPRAQPPGSRPEEGGGQRAGARRRLRREAALGPRLPAARPPRRPLPAAPAARLSSSAAPSRRSARRSPLRCPSAGPCLALASPPRHSSPAQPGHHGAREVSELLHLSSAGLRSSRLSPSRLRGTRAGRGRRATPPRPEEKLRRGARGPVRPPVGRVYFRVHTFFSLRLRAARRGAAAQVPGGGGSLPGGAGCGGAARRELGTATADGRRLARGAAGPGGALRLHDARGRPCRGMGGGEAERGARGGGPRVRAAEGPPS